MRDANFYRDLKKNYPVIERCEGVYLYDDAGKQYLDFGSGIGVTSIGCGVTEVVERLTQQLGNGTFVYNGYFTNVPRMKLSEKLLEFCSEAMSSVIFTSSGSEANEVAVKIARQWHLETGNASKYKVICRQQSYHGNTLGNLSWSGRPSWRHQFLPYLHEFPQIAAPYCYRCPFELQHPQCDIKCARELESTIEAEGPETVSVFIAEPIIGTTVSGVVPPPEYYRIIRDTCDKYDVLFIADEVITGIGRTGAKFGMDHWQIAPDIAVTGKGLAAGYAPLSAVIVSKSVFDGIATGTGKHTQGFTYSSNPLSCAAGLAVLSYIETNDLVQKTQEMGQYLDGRLQTLKDTGIMGDIRGKGLLQGIEFVANPEEKTPFPASLRLTERIVAKAFEMGLVLISGMPGCADGVNGDHIQLSPPFVITEAQIDEAVEIIQKAIEQSLDVA